MQATFVRNLPSNGPASQSLYRLDGRMRYTKYDGRRIQVNHVVVSTADVPYSGVETLVFAAKRSGEVVDWLELGGYRGGTSHARALYYAGLADNPDDRDGIDCRFDESGEVTYSFA